MSETRNILTIDSVDVHDDSACYVIAEIGHNHQGSLEQAMELMAAAKECGADAVKTQKRHNATLYTRAFYGKPYENENSFGATYGEHREALEFGRDEYVELRRYAAEIGITFFATAFDFASADFLAELDMPAYKIASGDLTNTPLLRYVAEIGKPIIFSTGGGTLDDVLRAYEAVAEVNDNVAILQCTAGYPADWEQLDLRVISSFAELLPERNGRLLEPRQRHRDAGRRLRARRAHRREALHAQPRDEGHRSRVLARAARACARWSATYAGPMSRSAMGASGSTDGACADREDEEEDRRRA